MEETAQNIPATPKPNPFTTVAPLPKTVGIIILFFIGTMYLYSASVEVGRFYLHFTLIIAGIGLLFEFVWIQLLFLNKLPFWEKVLIYLFVGIELIFALFGGLLYLLPCLIAFIFTLVVFYPILLVMISKEAGETNNYKKRRWKLLTTLVLLAWQLLIAVFSFNIIGPSVGSSIAL